MKQQTKIAQWWQALKISIRLNYRRYSGPIRIELFYRNYIMSKLMDLYQKNYTAVDVTYKDIKKAVRNAYIHSGMTLRQTINESMDYTISKFELRRPPKTNRNAPCPCGSGKKYKYCCIEKA